MGSATVYVRCSLHDIAYEDVVSFRTPVLRTSNDLPLWIRLPTGSAVSRPLMRLNFGSSPNVIVQAPAIEQPKPEEDCGC